VEPTLIPDYLALVGDSADGYPGLEGIRPRNRRSDDASHGAIEDFPPTVLGARRAPALLFKNLATLRTDAQLFDDVDELRWNGPVDTFAELAARMGNERLLARAQKASTPGQQGGASRAPPR
jgi:5'-3' exonuclease